MLLCRMVSVTVFGARGVRHREGCLAGRELRGAAYPTPTQVNAQTVRVGELSWLKWALFFRLCVRCKSLSVNFFFFQIISFNFI